MCFMKSPEAPPPPPPPPAAPPTLEQEVPQLSDANEEQSGLGTKSSGFKNYKIAKNNNYSASNTTSALGGMPSGGQNNS